MIVPVDLRVDGDPNPLGLDHGKPEFSWIPESAQRNQSQSAYRILVASSAQNLAKDVGDLWDSGKVESGKTLSIAYGGAPLRTASEYWWKVRLWDQDQAPSGWSGPTSFGIGPIDKDGWRASWIGRGPKTEPRLAFEGINGAGDAEKVHGPIPVEMESALLRREFVLPKPVKRAVVFVCGLGFYYLHLNGLRVGKNVLTPSKTDYREQVLYDAYDVTGLLRDGANAVGLMLGNGWYNPDKKWWDWHMQWHGSKRAIMQLHVQHADGTETRVVTDGSWKTALGPVQAHCLYDGELYDARLDQPGWDTTDFDDSAWTQANEVEAPGGVLRFHAIEPVQVTETIRPKTLCESAPGVWLFDMDQNFSGFARLRVRGERGTTIRLRHAENLNPDCTLGTATNNRALNTDTYILKGEGEEVYEPHFVYHGFRYVEVSGWPGPMTLDSIEGRVIHTSSRQTGELRTSNALINHIHRCTVWSQRSNMMGLPTDDNQRDERLGWMADGHLAAEQFMCNFEPVRFYRKWLRDMKCGQDPKTGNVPYIVPRPYFGDENGTPAWSSAYPLVAWYLYEYSGDKGILEEHLKPVCRYVDYLSTRAKQFILPPDRYGDHLSIADGWSRPGPELASTFYYFYDALLASRMAGELGRTAEESQYATLAGDIRKAFNETFFNKGRHCYGSNTHCEQILPLWMEMEPEDEHDIVLANLLRSVMEDNHGHLRVGILGMKYALDLLMAENRNDVAWALATQEDYPSFGYMTQGYTTLSETWNRTGTNNHVMWGHIDTWFYRGLAGIRSAPGYPGFERIFIRPHIPADLRWVRAAIHTLRGRVAVGWQRRDDWLHLDVTIPANTTAEVRLPTANVRGNCVFEGDNRMVWSDGFCQGTEGVLDGDGNDSWISFKVASGNYRFWCEWRADAGREMKSPWRADCSRNWRLSRLREAGDVLAAPCVKLADSLDWKAISGTPFINVHEQYGNADGLAYLGKRVKVKEAGEWLLHIGHDGGMRLFVDGKPVAEQGKRVNPAPTTRTSAKVKLSAGEHEIMVAFDTDKGMGWGFFASLEIPSQARKSGMQPTFPTTIV
jgi:alpha-L-rhamnosidase